jgi:hypothetical protein
MNSDKLVFACKNKFLGLNILNRGPNGASENPACEEVKDLVFIPISGRALVLVWHPSLLKY